MVEGQRGAPSLENPVPLHAVSQLAARLQGKSTHLSMTTAGVWDAMLSDLLQTTAKRSDYATRSRGEERGRYSNLMLVRKTIAG